jgi:Fe-S-cluster containining protein
LTVWPVEFYAILEAMKAANWPKPQLNEDQTCGYLDEEGCCQIYPFRPMICRTHGLPLVSWHEETDPPGYGVMFCEQNFTAADDIDFGSDTTLNMDTVNEKLARINIAFLEANPDLNLQPTNRIALRELL